MTKLILHKISKFSSQITTVPTIEIHFIKSRSKDLRYFQHYIHAPREMLHLIAMYLSSGPLSVFHLVSDVIKVLCLNVPLIFVWLHSYTLSILIALSEESLAV